MFQEKLFNTSEVVLNYAEGPNTGAPMVVLHGGTVAWEHMMPLLPALSEQRHVYAIDLRGHGKSGRAPNDDQYHAVDYGRDIAAFIRQQVDQPVVLIGHSLGTMAALAATVQIPECIRALILLDPPLFIRDLPIETKPEIAQWLHFLYGMIEKAHSVDDIMEMVRPFTPPERPEAETRKNAERIFSTAAGTLRLMFENKVLDGFDISAALDGLKCPLLIMGGEWDKGAVVRDTDVEFVRQHIPHVQFEKILNAGHQIHEDQTDVVLNHINRFLENAL